MKAQQLSANTRSVSELYGTVLIISLSFLMAMVLFGFGTFIMGNMGGETEDRVTQDAMVEMEDRLAEITGSGVTAGTTFSFPDADEDRVNTEPDHGQVTVTVEATENLELLEASEETNSTEFAVGTIRHTASNGEVTAYQGGAMIRQQDGFSTMLSEPPFDYDGSIVSLDFVDTTEIPEIRPGQELTAETDIEGAQQYSEEIEEILSPQWSYVGEGNFVAPVNITVTIETDYYEAWEEYAEEGMMESPDTVETDGSTIEMSFGNVGIENMQPGYAENEILFAGEAMGVHESFSRFNQNGTINGTEDGFGIEPVEGNENAFTVQNVQLAYYNQNKMEWLRLSQNENPNEPPSGNPSWYDISDDGLIFDNATEPVEFEKFEISPNEDVIEFHVNDSHDDIPLCIVSYDVNINQADSDGVIDYLETCAANLDVQDPSDYMPTDLEINFNDNQFDAEVGEEHEVNLTVENTGQIESLTEHDVALYYEQDGDFTLADYETSEEIGEIESGNNESITASWIPPSEDVDQLHAVVSEYDADNASVNVTDDGQEVAENHGFFEIESVDTIESVLAGQSLSVNATITNTGNETAERDVSLGHPDSQSIYDIETAELEPGETEEVELVWDTATRGTEAIEVSTQDDTETIELQVFSPADNDIGFGNPLGIDISLIEFADS